jgi:hypothetical protein
MSKVARVTFTVVAFNDKVKILDASGRSVATVDATLARAMSETDEKRLVVLMKWRRQLQQMATHFVQKVNRNAKCDWEKKCGVWMKSLRWRRNRKRHDRKTKLLHGRDRKDDLTWIAACQVLLAQYANRFYEKRKREKEPWRLWAQTVYSNLNKRREIIRERVQHDSSKTDWESDDQAIDAKGGKPRLQMCLHWD